MLMKSNLVLSIILFLHDFSGTELFLEYHEFINHEYNF